MVMDRKRLGGLMLQSDPQVTCEEGWVTCSAVQRPLLGFHPANSATHSRGVLVRRWIRSSFIMLSRKIEDLGQRQALPEKPTPAPSLRLTFLQ